ncbi:MAG TPA: VOC family protein [Thermoanaerobaculia bacterium]|nr:VOC family protein [Thermoanaerobaculia bacterium]
MPFAVHRIDHVEVLVSDLEAAARWYREVLGLVEIRRWDPEPVMIGASGTTGGSMLALFLADPVAAVDGLPDASDAPVAILPAHRWQRVAWQTDEAGFAAAQERLRSLGIRFRGPVDHDVARSIYFADPDGNPLEITYYL